MRLRLWWHLCVLESRAPEDQGFQPAVDVTNPRLRLPLNVDDNQICPDMTRLPEESDGWTDMSFCLLQTESCRLMHPILNSQEQHPADGLRSIAEKRTIVEERARYLRAKYPGTPAPLWLMRVQHGNTARKKMEFVLQLREEISRRQQKGAQDDAAPDVLRPSFRLACDGLECSYGSSEEGGTSRFKWFFNLYTPWYALAYILRCLCSSPCGAEAERAWALVDELYPRAMSLHSQWAGIHQDEYGHGSIWRCLDRLRHQAFSARQHAQLYVATVDVEIQPSGSGAQLLPGTEVGRPATALGPSIRPEPDEGLVTDQNQSGFTAWDLSMPDFTLLPDWNAVINGGLNHDGDEIGPSFSYGT